MTGQIFTPTEMIARLVSYDTTSHKSNLALIDFVADYLAGHGIESTRVFDDEGGKANLFATIGDENDGGVVLSGHTDVVPVDGQDWSSDPFTMVERDGRLFGRGTADMKSFIALALTAVPELIAARPRIPVHLALSYDEEIGCLGAPRLVKLLKAAPFTPLAVIVGEPTSMSVVDRHKSGNRFATEVTGREAHSAHTDKGVSANLVAGRLIAFLDGLARKAWTRPDDGFDPPYDTLHVGIVEGGTASNILARHCRFIWEVRTLPSTDLEAEFLAPFQAFIDNEVLPEMRTVAPESGVLTEATVAMEALAPMVDSPAEALARKLAGFNGPTGSVSFGTEGGLFAGGGIPTVVCGPGSILQAHRADEYIDLAQIDACVTFMERLVDHVRS
jgi:acetylornithine deacetylase